MKRYADMSREELLNEKASLEAVYKEIQESGLSLNMARGKPEPGQLDLSMGMFDLIGKDAKLYAEDGTDCRNYGVLTGIPEARRLFAQILECRPEQVIVGNNASLNLMYDAIARAWYQGVLGNTPWSRLPAVKFLCPVPGYDRHFAITQSFGIEMINIPILEDGPDMDMIEALVAEDALIKGIWCVPKYGNPTGVTYSDEVVRRFASMKTAAEDFRIFWDNAYGVHDLDYENRDVLLPLLEACEQAGNPNRVYEFASFSKITLAGASISCIAASEENIEAIKKSITVQTIGSDKINQWMHVKFLPDLAAVTEHMKKHAAILRPKFAAFDEIMTAETGDLGIGTWTMPKGGYFICFRALSGCAKRIVSLCKDAGVTLTGAGAPFPYKIDPEDSVIRIAPSYPCEAEMRKASEIFAVCVKLASLEKYLEA